MSKCRQYVSILGLCLLIGMHSLLPAQPVQAQSGDQAWILDQINSLRARLGLHAYVWNAQLAAAAQQHSQYMADTGHISHTETNGSTPASRAVANGYGGSWVSENIYGGSRAGPSAAMNFWLNSSVHYAGLAHRRNNEIGIGVASGANGNFYTLVFGYRSNIQAPPAADVAAPAPPAADGSTDSVANDNPPPARPPATRVPPTFTPTATIPSVTPTITWTPTATWTPSPTVTVPPATSTPIQLPTVAVVAVAPTESSIFAMPSPSMRPASNAATIVGPDPAQEETDDSMLLFVIGGAAVLGLGLLFVGYGLYSMKRA